MKVLGNLKLRVLGTIRLGERLLLRLLVRDGVWRGGVYLAPNAREAQCGKVERSLWVTGGCV